MVRPTLPDDKKRKPIAARFSPEDRVKIEKRARKRGRSPNAEVEALATAFLNVDVETADLLSAIAIEISELEATTGKRWHKDVKTWAAVVEALAKGAIQDARPDRPYDDEAIRQNWDTADALRDKQKPLIEKLEELEVPVAESKLGNLPFFRLLAGQPEDDVIERTKNNTRYQTRFLIDLLPDGEKKSEIHNLLDEIERIDLEIEKLEIELNDLMRPYRQVEENGREIGRKYLQVRAERRQQAGLRFNSQNWLRIE